jgi:ribosomal protein S18 acetylase RimI-like enzyme
MIRLEPMPQEDFASYLERDIREYAEEHVRNGNWKKEEALERSRKEHDQLLPDGLQSKDQYLFSIIDDTNNQKLGVLWVTIQNNQAFIYDFRIDEAFRGKGYGKLALMAMDEKLKSMRVRSVELHVFGDNYTAQELYKKMGFEITGIHMRKQLEAS